MSPRIRRQSADPISRAQAQTLATFEKLLEDQLKPIMGPAGLKRIRRDLAICTSVGGGVVIQAPLEFAARSKPQRLERRPEIFAVFATTVTLFDPVTLRALRPGAYALGIRKLSAKAIVFDFFNQHGAPALSVLARQKNDAGTDAGVDQNVIDIEITVSSGTPDSMMPPGEVYICVSLLDWKYCFFFSLPEWKWPF